MRKLMVLLAVLSVGLFQVAFAQGGVSFGVSGTVALPMGDFGSEEGLDASTGFGGLANVQYGISPNIALTGSAGYLMWGGPEAEIFGTKISFDYSAIPVQAGVKYLIGTAESRPYIKAETGVHMFRVKAEVGGQSETESETKFGFSGGAGYELKLGSGSTKLDISGHYQFVSKIEEVSISYIGIRLGVLFGGGS